MDLITENSGLDLIGIKIFGYLSPEDTFKCCFVSKSWQVFIIQNRKRLGGTKIMPSNLGGLVKRLLQCTCPYHIYSLHHEGLLDTCIEIVYKPKSVDCFKACILLKAFNIEQLILKAVIKGWVEFFKFLIPYAKNEGIDFNKTFPSIQEEPYNKRPLLHNLVCTEHCNRKILEILFKLNVDVIGKDGNGCRAIELALAQLPMEFRVIFGTQRVIIQDLPTVSDFDAIYSNPSEDPKASLRDKKYTRRILYYYSEFLSARKSWD